MLIEVYFDWKHYCKYRESHQLYPVWIKFGWKKRIAWQCQLKDPLVQHHDDHTHTNNKQQWHYKWPSNNFINNENANHDDHTSKKRERIDNSIGLSGEVINGEDGGEGSDKNDTCSNNDSGDNHKSNKPGSHNGAQTPYGSESEPLICDNCDWLSVKPVVKNNLRWHFLWFRSVNLHDIITRFATDA